MCTLRCGSHSMLWLYTRPKERVRTCWGGKLSLFSGCGGLNRYIVNLPIVYTCTVFHLRAVAGRLDHPPYHFGPRSHSPRTPTFRGRWSISRQQKRNTQPSATVTSKSPPTPHKQEESPHQGTFGHCCYNPAFHLMTVCVCPSTSWKL